MIIVTMAGTAISTERSVFDPARQDEIRVEVCAALIIYRLEYVLN